MYAPNPKQAELEALYAPHRRDPQASPLFIPGSTHIVFGEGNPDANLVFIGEAPGAEEDKQGRPFVGRSGKLLDQCFEQIGISRDDVYITNIVKCRPPNNRTPTHEELEAGKQHMLQHQLAIIAPRVICTLGSSALNGLEGKQYGVTRVRGRFLEKGNVKLIPTYHPAYTLRKQNLQSTLLEDISKAFEASK